VQMRFAVICVLPVVVAKLALGYLSTLSIWCM